MKGYTENKKLRISDLSLPYLLDAANYLFKVSVMNVHQELKASVDLAVEESDVLNKMNAFSRQTGTSGNGILNVQNGLRNPELLRDMRAQKIKSL